MRRALATSLTLLLATAPMALAADVKPLAIGTKAPDFRLPGVDGKSYTLADFASSKALVVVFTCNHCPTAQAYEARLEKFYDTYRDKGVALVAISPNDPKAVRLDELGFTDLDDSFEAMKVRAKDHHYPYPYLYDGDTQATAHAFGVLATPHVYIFDADRTLRYQGRWDDGEVKPVKSQDAINAVDAILNGSEVPVKTTRVTGCSTKWAEKRKDAAASLAKWDAEPVGLETIDDAGVAKLVKNDGDRLLVVNLWATWCGPCVAELDDLVTMNRMYRGRKFRMVTISMDEPSKQGEAHRVLTEHHASTKNYLLSSSDKDKFAEVLDKQWPGPVPYTMVIAPGGKVIYRHSGAFEPLELKRAIVGQLGRTY
ncbi:MAG TPA: redoxin domain-containing protein [Isosphaeraceae bacterium]|jgi:peroxiredoxin